MHILIPPFSVLMKQSRWKSTHVGRIRVGECECVGVGVGFFVGLGVGGDGLVGRGANVGDGVGTLEGSDVGAFEGSFTSGNEMNNCSFMFLQLSTSDDVILLNAENTSISAVKTFF